MKMDDLQLDADGFTEEIRRFIVQNALDRVQAHGFKPNSYVLDIYDRYVTGVISRKESSRLLAERLDELYGKGSGARIK
jgi:phosphoribosylanthranilate isomerase